MIDLDYFCWREPTKDASGNDRLLIPWADSMQHEFPFDFVYATAQEAIDSKDDYDDAADEEWVLVHYVGTVLPTSSDDLRAFAAIIDELGKALDRAVEGDNHHNLIDTYERMRREHNRARNLMVPDDFAKVKPLFLELAKRVLVEGFKMSPDLLDLETLFP